METPQIQIFPANILTTEVFVAAAFLTPSTLLVSVKQNREQLKKYLEQANIIALSDTYFLIDEFDTFINKNTNIKPA